MRIGVELSYGFGDALFGLPLIKALSEQHQSKIDVAVMHKCADAFYNIPWVGEIILIGGLNHGLNHFRNTKYDKYYQFTQNVKFEEFKSIDHNHSLIDTPLLTGRQLEIELHDQCPIFIPTEQELSVGERYNDGLPNIAIESVYTSAQSWADSRAFEMILEKYADTHRICWLSNSGAPQTKYMDDMLRWTRREAICTLKHCQIFFSTGSGFFCASLGLPPSQQPRKIICMFNDSYYRYKDRLTELQFHPNIVWISNHDELNHALTL